MEFFIFVVRPPLWLATMTACIYFNHLLQSLLVHLMDDQIRITAVSNPVLRSRSHRHCHQYRPRSHPHHHYCWPPQVQSPIPSPPHSTSSPHYPIPPTHPPPPHPVAQPNRPPRPHSLTSTNHSSLS